VKKFIIIDGNSLTYKAFYAMPYLSNRQKQPSGAVFGFANVLVKLIAENKPDYIAVAFDHSRQTFRNEIFADYKGTRKETPEDLKSQFPVVREMLDRMNIKYFEVAGIEADDIIGTLAKNSGMQNILVSGDRDLLQLVDKNTTVWLSRKGVSEVEAFDESHLMDVWGITPREVVDLKALMGDASDNIPGVAGVGEKTAISLLQKYEGLDGVYEHLSEIGGKLNEKLMLGKESAYMSQKLATIKTDCVLNIDLEECKTVFPFSQSVRDFFEDWDFRSLTNRKDIFGEGVRSSKVELKKHEFADLQEVENFAKNVKNVFCYDIKNLEFYTGGEEVFGLKKELDLFSVNLDFDEVLKRFKSIFEDAKILKITSSAKDDIKILKKLGINLKNFFDVEIARYVLYAGLPKLPAVRVGEFVALKDRLTKEMQEADVEKIYKDIEIPLVDVLVDMELEGFKLDEDILDDLAQKFDAELKELTEKIYDLAGQVFNINSPKQVAGILFDKLGLTSYNNKKQSTNFAILDDIRDQHEIVDLIIRYRKTSKLVSTYINVYKSICERDGAVVKTSFNQTLTATGRLSSSEPNMQNIPTRNEEGKALRKIFVSKYDGGKIVSADYSQIELRLLANMAKENSMIDAYKHGIDIHTKTASEIFGVAVEDVTSAQRRDAKAVNFGIIYGISDYGLSQNIKTSRGKAKEYMDNYFNRYPKIKDFMDQNVEYAKKQGMVKSYFGRIRHIPEMGSSNAMVRKFAERVAMNMPLQGTASDIIKMAMVDVFNKLKEKNMKSHLILQIHDELIIDAPADEVCIVEKMLKESMESVHEFEVPLTVSVSSGTNLFECK